MTGISNLQRGLNTGYSSTYYQHVRININLFDR